jgi:hypothetical protein
MGFPLRFVPYVLYRVAANNEEEFPSIIEKKITATSINRTPSESRKKEKNFEIG